MENIIIDGVDTNVYRHPSGTNPHGLTKADLSLGNVENKNSETILSEITSGNVTSALGYTPYNKTNGDANTTSISSINTELKKRGIFDDLLGSVSVGSNISFENLIKSRRITFFTNWTDNTNFPHLYSSGIFIPGLDHRNKTILYFGTTGVPTVIRTFAYDSSTGEYSADSGWQNILAGVNNVITSPIQIQSATMNGAYNGLLIGDDCYIGDCNTGHAIGVMSAVDNNLGYIKFGKGGSTIGFNGTNMVCAGATIVTDANIGTRTSGCANWVNGDGVPVGDPGSNTTGIIVRAHSISGNTGIFNGNGDGVGYDGYANLIIKSWQSVGFADGCTNQGMTVGIDCRSGAVGLKKLCGLNNQPWKIGTTAVSHITVSQGATNFFDLSYDGNTNSMCRFACDTTKGSISPVADGTLQIGFSTNRCGQIYSTNSTISTSDRTLKTDISDMDPDTVVNFVNGVIPKTYKFKDNTSDRTHWGAVAQDIEVLLNETGIGDKGFAGFIKTPNDRESDVIGDDGKPTGEKVRKVIPEGEEGYGFRYGLRYEEFIMPLYRYSQILYDTCETQKEQITELESKVSNLEDVVLQLLTRVKSLESNQK